MIDELNIKLIQELQNDGRESYTQLAKKFGVSEGTIRRRVRELQKHDVMKIRAVVNNDKIGYGFVSVMALQVNLADLRKVADILAGKPNIRYLALVAGRYDMVAIVMDQTPKGLSDFIRDHISTIPGIIRIETFVNLETIKNPWLETWDIVQLLGS